MSNRLTLCEAARQSGIGLDELMKAIRSGGLLASRCEQNGYVVATRDLDRYVAAQVRETPARKALKRLPPVSCNKASTGSIEKVRSAFGTAPAPAPKPPVPEAVVRPARDLGHWCESYLDDLRKIDWYLRKLEADARWLDEKLNGQ
jgi:hypothetical protein